MSYITASFLVKYAKKVTCNALEGDEALELTVANYGGTSGGPCSIDGARITSLPATSMATSLGLRNFSMEISVSHRTGAEWALEIAGARYASSLLNGYRRLQGTTSNAGKEIQMELTDASDGRIWGLHMGV